MCSGHALDYTINITTYICYFSVSTDKVHHSAVKAQLLYIYMNKKKATPFVRIISFTNRKANSLKFISVYFYSNMSITKQSKIHCSNFEVLTNDCMTYASI